MGVLLCPQLPLPTSHLYHISDNSPSNTKMAGTLANWSCAGVCGEVSQGALNLTLCCVASCEYQVL